PAITYLYSLSLHDALPICAGAWQRRYRFRRSCSWLVSLAQSLAQGGDDKVKVLSNPSELSAFGDSRFKGLLHSSMVRAAQHLQQDRKSTRLNSSHVKISYA